MSFPVSLYKVSTIVNSFIFQANIVIFSLNVRCLSQNSIALNWFFSQVSLVALSLSQSNSLTLTLPMEIAISTANGFFFIA